MVTRVGENDLRLDMLFTMFGVFGLLVSGCSLLLLWVKGQPAPGNCFTHNGMGFLFVCLLRAVRLFTQRYVCLFVCCCCCLLVGWFACLLFCFLLLRSLTRNGMVYRVSARNGMVY